MVNLNNKDLIAVIPARGGSKRIPGKNIIEFMGKPLISWTIEAAQKSNLFDKIIVSTDDPKIAQVAVEYGAEVPFFRNEANDDYSPVSEATLATIDQVETSGIGSFKTVVQLFAVCPLRDSQEIIDSVNFFYEKEANFLISCYEFNWMNPWWAFKVDSNNHPTPLFPEALKRSQDLPKLFAPTGAIWIANIERLKEAKTFYGPDYLFWPIDWKSAVDIDNYEDLKIAEMLFKLKAKDE